MTTLSGFGLRKRLRQRIGGIRSALFPSLRLRELNLDPPRFTATSSGKCSPSASDVLHWTGQGSCGSSLATTTSNGSAPRAPRTGVWHLSGTAASLGTVLLFLALGPLLGALLTLVTLASLTPSTTDLPASSSLHQPGYGRRSTHSN